jgi:hypothetical protein
VAVVLVGGVEDLDRQPSARHTSPTDQPAATR